MFNVTFISVFSGFCIAHCAVFCVGLCRTLFVLFRLATVLYVLLRFTALITPLISSNISCSTISVIPLWAMLLLEETGQVHKSKADEQNMLLCIRISFVQCRTRQQNITLGSAQNKRSCTLGQFFDSPFALFLRTWFLQNLFLFLILHFIYFGIQCLIFTMFVLQINLYDSVLTINWITSD